MKFNILPAQFVAETREADNKENALIDFATTMDLDMSTYFKPVSAEETSSEMAKQIVSLIAENQFDASEYEAIFNELNKQREVFNGKLWTAGDIRLALREKKIPDNEYNIQVVWSHLNECNEAGSNTIADAIDTAIEDEEFLRYAINIEWNISREDFDNEAEYEAVSENLPVYVEIVDGIREEDVADYIEEKYDYSVKSFRISYEPTQLNSIQKICGDFCKWCGAKMESEDTE